MSGTTPADESRVKPALTGSLLRRRASTAVLYWRFVRPRVGVYAVAWARLVAYRIAAAVMAIIVLGLASLDGSLVGAIGYPHWRPPYVVDARTLTNAIVQAGSFSCRLAPVILMLGLVLVIIPRPHRWHFRMTVLGVVALSCFGSTLPSLAGSKLSAEISRQLSLAANSAFSRETGPQALYSLGLLAGTIAVITFPMYWYCYALAIRTADSIPHRPRNHRRSTFLAVSVARRLIAAIVAAIALAMGLWLVQSARQVLLIRHATQGPWHVQFTLIEWILITIVAGLTVSASRPNGSRWCLVALLTILTFIAFWPYNAFPLPVGIPAAGHGFWPLIIAYFLVTGLSFDLVTALLDWPL